MNLTDLELQVWCMASWLSDRPWPDQPSEGSEAIARLIELGLVSERFEKTKEDPDGIWRYGVTREGKKFDEIDVLVRIHTYIRCGLLTDAGILIGSLAEEELPEFLVHGDVRLRRCARRRMRACGQ